MLVFILGIVLCLLLIICAITNTIVYYVIALGAIILVGMIVLYVYKTRELIARKKGRLDVGELVYCKYLLPFKGKGYHIVKFKYVDDKGKPRTRIDLVNYSDYDMLFLDHEGTVDIVVYKSFATTIRPTYKPKKVETNKEDEDEKVTKESLKECPYCGYKTFENDFKCPMCGGDLDIKTTKKAKNKKDN